jgi:hypothetical protein
MHTSPTGEHFEKRGFGYLTTVLFIILAAAAYVVLPGLADHDIAEAAICASCHTDGRTGVPPATPTHIRMGLVSAPKAAATTAGKAAAPKTTTTTSSAPKATATTAKTGASRTKTAAAGNASVCAGCHQDGRSGPTPAGHRSVTGMFGNGSAPPPKNAAGGGTAIAPGGKGKVAAGGGGANKMQHSSEGREGTKPGHEREDD